MLESKGQGPESSFYFQMDGLGRSEEADLLVYLLNPYDDAACKSLCFIRWKN